MNNGHTNRSPNLFSFTLTIQRPYCTPNVPLCGITRANNFSCLITAGEQKNGHHVFQCAAGNPVMPVLFFKLESVYPDAEDEASVLCESVFGMKNISTLAATIVTAT